MYRKGNVPRRGEDSELIQHAWTRKGFFGAYANIYKTRNPGEPTRWDPRLGPSAIEAAATRPGDLDQADGSPLPLLTNGDITVSVSRRRAPMPFCWRNVDADELYFIHRGASRFETEFGWIEAEPGDFVYLPRNVVYRAIPHTEETVHLILETKSMLETAERYHRDHGETNAGLDMSLIVVPEPGETTGPRQDEYEVRLKVDGQYYSMFFDYDPVGVTAGWAGDPIVFKLSGWDVPCSSLPSTPPTAAVFMTDGSEAVVTVHTPMQLINTRGGGPPAHTNDYDELWFLHTTQDVGPSDRVGKLRWDPQGITQPGFVRRNGDAPRRPSDVPSMNVNIDVRHRLHLTDEALQYVEQRQAAAAARV
jgi:homogentisate 1,2-dioxygenase